MIAVVGCGRIGLPLALALARSGYRVIGVENDPARASALAAGQMPFDDHEAAGLLKDLIGDSFTVTTDLEAAMGKTETVIIAVATPLDDRLLPVQEPVVALAAAALRLAPRRPLGLVIRSTLAPGFSQRLVARMEARYGARLGRDFLFAYCPDRCAGGRFLREMRQVPQIIGAFDEDGATMARNLFASPRIPCLTTRPTEAELAKLFNNAYRYVNFALANQCLMLAEEASADPQEALRVARTGYQRGGPWAPGYAAGPCLLKDSFFLQSGVPTHDLLTTAWKINEHLPEYLIHRAETIRPLRGAAVLGTGYKAGIDDTRLSQGEKLIRLLEARGIPVAVHDPTGNWPGARATVTEVLAAAHEVFVTVPETSYRRILWTEMASLVSPDALLIDPWNLWGQGKTVAAITAGSKASHMPR